MVGVTIIVGVGMGDGGMDIVGMIVAGGSNKGLAEGSIGVKRPGWQPPSNALMITSMAMPGLKADLDTMD